MREHRVRVLLERGLVALRVRRALVGRRYQLARLGDDGIGLAGDVGHVIVEGLVDAHDQLRQRPEPGELGVVENGLEQRMTGRAAVDAIVRSALPVEQRLVQLQQRLAKIA